MAAKDTPAASNDSDRWKILGVMLVSVFMSLISVSIVNVALPSIQQGLSASSTDVQWVLTGYALIFGVVLVAAGRAGDIFGRGGLFLVGLTLFLTGSAVAGISTSPGMLNSARLLQGMGAGFLNPQILGMIQTYFTAQERGRAFGFFGTTVGIAVAIGPVLGGLLIKLGGVTYGWRLTMMVNLPVGLTVVILALLWLPRPLFSVRRIRRADGSWLAFDALRILDPVGVVLLGAAVLMFMLPFVESEVTRWRWLLLPASALMAAAWVGWERRYKARGHEPIVDLDVLSVPSFRNGASISALYFVGATSIWVIVAMYMQEGLGHSALVAGTIGIPCALVSAASADWAGRHLNTYGRALVVGGMSVAAFGMVLSIIVVLFEARGVVSEWWLIATMTVVGLGQGATVSPNQALSLTEVPLEYAGSSGALLQVGQRIGTSVGLALMTAILFSVLSHHSWPVAVAVSFATIVLVMLGSIAIGVIDLRQRQTAA